MNSLRTSLVAALALVITGCGAEAPDDVLRVSGFVEATEI